MSDILDKRRRALEESFFAKVDAELMARLQASLQTAAATEALAAFSGIDDAKLLNCLVQQGIHAETWAALSLVPLVEVGWADGRMQDQEREAILRAAAESGIDGQSSAGQLLAHWLTEQPNAALRQAWVEYVREFVSTCSTEEKGHLKESVLGRARGVAEAAGGFLGMGNSISPQEEKVLDELASAMR